MEKWVSCRRWRQSLDEMGGMLDAGCWVVGSTFYVSRSLENPGLLCIIPITVSNTLHRCHNKYGEETQPF